MIKIFAGTITALWAGVLLMGLSLIHGTPSGGHAPYYLGVPAAVLTVVIIASALLGRPGFKAPAILVLVAALAALPAYLFYYTGGV